jgi:hypothetical protein
MKIKLTFKQGKEIAPNEMIAWYTNNGKKINAARRNTIEMRINSTGWYYIAHGLDQYQKTGCVADVK